MSRCSRRIATLFLVTCVIGLLASVAGAQPLGTFRWQLQPYCNIVTLNATFAAGVYTLDGVDDQCGASRMASVVGIAYLNPDGTIGLGLTMVAPAVGSGHVTAAINLASLSGTWRDSVGNSGALVFTPGAGTGGSTRPVASNGLAPGSITAAQVAPGTITAAQLAPGTLTGTHLAPGTIGASQVNASQVQTRVGGACAVGRYLRGINADGSVVCEPLLTPNVSTTVDDPPNIVGEYTSIAIGADGLPIISHWDRTADALRVTHCGNTACTAGNLSSTVDEPAEDVGQYTSIAIGVDGFPIISHWDATARALRVTHCSNLACTTATSVTADDQVFRDVGQFTSIAIGTDGLPIISHHDATADALRVTHCGNTACTAGNVSTTVDDPDNSVGYFTSIAIGADGLPVISYFDVTADALRVTPCGNAACTAGNVSTTVDDPANELGGSSSIAIGADGLPIVSYYDITGDGVRVTHCGNSTCTAGNVTIGVRVGYAGPDLSIAIGADGLPLVGYFDRNTFALRVTHCGNLACTAGNVSTAVDDPGQDISIAIGADGLPVISHRANNALRVTKCATRTCQ